LIAKRNYFFILVISDGFETFLWFYETSLEFSFVLKNYLMIKTCFLYVFKVFAGFWLSVGEISARNHSFIRAGLPAGYSFSCCVTQWKSWFFY